jgi:polygalacturonase
MPRFFHRLHILAFTLAVIWNWSISAGAMEEFQVAPPEIPDRTFTLTDYGAIGDGKSINTEAFTKAIAAIKAAGGGQLIVPKGEFLTGPMVLVSHMDLHLEDGAKIQFPSDWATFAQALPTPDAAPEDRPNAGASTEPTASFGRGNAGGIPGLIYGNNLTDVAVTGSGAIDGGGSLFWGAFVAQREAAARRGSTADIPATARSQTNPGDFAAVRQRVRRPRTIVLQNAKRVRLQGVEITNSPNFHVVPTHCEDVLIDGLRVKAPYNSPNTDALDPISCTRVIIRNCVLDVGDDNVAIKTIVGYPSLPAQDILVENCTCLHGHGISVGSETYGGIQRVLVRNCTFDGGDQAIRIKSARDRGNILSDFTFSNIQMKNIAKTAISINLYYQNPQAQKSRESETVTPKTPHLSDVHIDHVTGVACNKACDLVGLPEAPIEDIAFSDVSVDANTGAVIQDVKHVVFKNVAIKVKIGDPLTVDHAEDSELTLVPWTARADGFAPP